MKTPVITITDILTYLHKQLERKIPDTYDWHVINETILMIKENS